MTGVCEGKRAKIVGSEGVPERENKLARESRVIVQDRGQKELAINLVME